MKQENLHKAAKGVKDEGRQNHGFNKGLEDEPPLATKCKGEDEHESWIITPAYKVGTLPAHGSKKGPPEAARWGGTLWISTSEVGKSNRLPMPEKAMQLTTDDA